MKEHARQRVADIATVFMGQSPPSTACTENEDGLPFIQGNAEFGSRFPAPRLRCSAPTRIAEAGDLLLSVRAPVGEVNQSNTRMVIGRGLCAVRMAERDQQYAWHALRWAVTQLNRVAQGSTFVAVSRKGKLGDTYFIEGDFWPHDTSLWVTDFSGNSERFCALLLKHMRLERLDAATSVPTLNRNNVYPLTIALPRRSEQDRIVRRVSLFDDDVNSEMWLVAKMQKIKTGLTSDLLTGRVRVPEGVFT